MKKSINAWSVDGNTGFKEMFEQIKAVGFDGIELNVDADGQGLHSLTMDIKADKLKEIKAISDDTGLPVVSISSGLYWGTMGNSDPKKRAFAGDVIKKQLECAEALGAGGILVVPSGIAEDVSIQKAYEYSYETISSVKNDINAAKINVGLENVWNGFFMSPMDMARFIDSFECAYIGAYYDVGNVIAFSWSEYWIEVLGNRIRNVHIKDFKRNGGINSGGDFVDLLKGDVCFKKVIPALRKAGFDGYLTAEVGKSDDISFDTFYKEVNFACGEIIKL